MWPKKLSHPALQLSRAHLTCGSPISPTVTLQPFGGTATPDKAERWINRNEEGEEEQRWGKRASGGCLVCRLFPHACEGVCDLALEPLLLEAADESLSIDMHKECG